MLVGFERLDVSARAKVLNQLVFVLAGAAALWLGLNYFGLVIANLLGVALMTYVCWRGVRALGVRPLRAAAASWPALLRASLPFGVIGLALGLSYKFDTVLLNIFRSDAETGYYNAAYNLVFSSVLFSNAFNTALYPSLARQATSAGLVTQTVQSVQDEVHQPRIETGRREAPVFTQDRHRHAIHQVLQQRVNSTHQAHIIPPIRGLQASLQGFDGRARQLYSQVHGCSLLRWVWQSYSEEIHPFVVLRQPQLSKPFS
jgi:hypothetical protein